MGFLPITAVGFADPSSGSLTSIQGSTFVFKEQSSVISITETFVASREATANITYELPDKDTVPSNNTYKFVNMNASYNINLADFQDGAIDEANPFVLAPKTGIALVLDKDNGVWKIINGI
jgi:hypothetical protein